MNTITQFSFECCVNSCEDFFSVGFFHLSRKFYLAMVNCMAKILLHMKLATHFQQEFILDVFTFSILHNTLVDRKK